MVKQIAARLPAMMELLRHRHPDNTRARNKLLRRDGQLVNILVRKHVNKLGTKHPKSLASGVNENNTEVARSSSRHVSY